MSKMKRTQYPLHGWLALDKPYGMGSTQAVAAVRRIMGAAKIGHGGTLDPLATGCLPIAMGEATKTVSFMMDATKTYQFEITFGAQTTTLDVEGEVVARSDVRPSLPEIEAVLPQFLGCIEQMPPVFSALKVNGKRAYDLARAGEDVTLQTRPVMIHALRVLAMPAPDAVMLEVVCGKGTYVRSLARDIALALGTVGHVTVLRRLQVGPLDAKVMISLEKLEEMVYDLQLTVNGNEENNAKLLNSLLLPPDAVLDDIPVLRVDKVQHTRLIHGLELRYSLDELADALACEIEVNEIFRIYCEDNLVALASWRGGAVRSERMFML